MPPRKRAQGKERTAAAAAASAAAAAQQSQQRPPQRKRKAAPKQADDDDDEDESAAVAVAGGEDKSSSAPHAAASAASAAAASSAGGDGEDAAMPAATDEGDGDEDAAESGAAAAGALRSSKRPPAKSRASKKAKLSAKLTAAQVQAAVDAQEKMLQQPKSPAVDASRCPPPHGLHADALHTLFAFTSQRDLAHLIRLSRAWYGGVVSVPWCSLHAEHSETFSVAELCASPLARHIGSLSIQSQVNRQGITALELKLLRAYMPNLRSLETKLLMKVSDVGPWMFPANLQTLRLTPKHTGQLSVPTVLSLLVGVGALHRLSHLELHLSQTKEVADLSPLQAVAAQLEEFHFECTPRGQESPQQLQQQEFVRQMINVRRLTYTPIYDPNGASHVLRDPIPFARLEEIVVDEHTPLLSDGAADRLQRVHTLTKLNLDVPSGDFSFLTHLTRLRSLSLRFNPCSALDFATPFSAALSSCADLTSLSLVNFRASSETLVGALRAVPLLSQLTLINPSDLTSLAFLAAAPNLTRLRIFGLTVGSSYAACTVEAQHLSLLTRLEVLDASMLFRSGPWPEPITNTELTPPSRICPSLRAVRYRQVRSAGETVVGGEHEWKWEYSTHVRPMPDEWRLQE